MTRQLFKLEEAKALFYGGFFILIGLIFQMLFKVGQTFMIVTSIVLIAGAYFLESAEDKFNIFERYRSQ
jgi:hypothetical protein|tara:strand:- start:12369 stop:12575 length:207 start_codon:yes stop_codon:yes gene_type:complete